MGADLGKNEEESMRENCVQAQHLREVAREGGEAG